MKKDAFSDPKVMTAPEAITNEQKVMRIFEYFGKGDIQSIVDMCSDDCDFLHGGDAIIPFAKPFKGKKGAAQFFQTIAQNIDVSKIVPSNFKVKPNEISHDFYVEATAKATGRPYSVTALYQWVFDQNGKICRHRSTGDFSKVEAAFRA